VSRKANSNSPRKKKRGTKRRSREKEKKKKEDQYEFGEEWGKGNRDEKKASGVGEVSPRGKGGAHQPKVNGKKKKRKN